MMKYWLASATLLVSGCGTYQSLNRPMGEGPLVLGGTRTDLAVVAGDRASDASGDQYQVLLSTLDLPFSLMADIALLPSTVVWALWMNY